MSPDDPRHGTYAGYMAHHKHKHPMCDACAHAGYLTRKRFRANGSKPTFTTLGEDAYRKLVNSPKSTLSRATGIGPNRLHNLQQAGPEQRVKITTQQKILAARIVTPIGITRRMRALARIGWSAAAVARAAGVSRWNVEDARRRDGRKFVRAGFEEALVAAYDELHMKLPPTTRATARQIAAAKRNGWPGPLAWEDIDDPNEQPGLTQPARDDEYDEAAVIRLISGEHIPARPADKIEAMRRWVAKGGSARELCRIHGWKEGRYVIGVAA